MSWDLFSFAPHVNKLVRLAYLRGVCWRIRHPPDRLPHDSQQKWEKSVSLKCDIFLKTHGIAKGAFIRRMRHAFICMHALFNVFWTVKEKPSTAINTWNSQGNFYITQTGFVWKKKSYTRMARGWVKHGIIFIFGWTNPLIINEVYSSHCILEVFIIN